MYSGAIVDVPLSLTYLISINFLGITCHIKERSHNYSCVIYTCTY